MNRSGPYIVLYDPKAFKELQGFDKPMARRLARVVESLALDPRPHGARPLVGYPDLWRVRSGDHRIIYTVNDAELIVLAVRIAHARRRSPGWRIRSVIR